MAVGQVISPDNRILPVLPRRLFPSPVDAPLKTSPNRAFAYRGQNPAVVDDGRV